MRTTYVPYKTRQWDCMRIAFPIARRVTVKGASDCHKYWCYLYFFMLHLIFSSYPICIATSNGGANNHGFAWLGIASSLHYR